MSDVATGGRTLRALGGGGGTKWLLLAGGGAVGFWYFFMRPADEVTVVRLHPSASEIQRQEPPRPEPEPPREPQAELPPPAAPTPPASPPPTQEVRAPVTQSAPVYAVSAGAGFQRLGQARPPVVPSSGQSASVTGSQQGGLTFAAPQIQGTEAIAVGDLQRTIRPGTLIRFSLKRALDGGQGGNFSGAVKDEVKGWDIYGPPLIEPGASVEGEYEVIQNGGQRLIAFAAYITTGSGLIVPLGNSVVLDELGRAGIPGSVRSRTWARLGNAVLFDAASAAFRLPGQALQNLGSGFNLNLNVDPRSPEVAAALLQQSMAIRDEFKAMQGTELTVAVKAPIRFPMLRFRETGR